MKTNLLLATFVCCGFMLGTANAACDPDYKSIADALTGGLGSLSSTLGAGRCIELQPNLSEANLPIVAAKLDGISLIAALTSSLGPEQKLYPLQGYWTGQLAQTVSQNFGTRLVLSLKGTGKAQELVLTCDVVAISPKGTRTELVSQERCFDGQPHVEKLGYEASSLMAPVPTGGDDGRWRLVLKVTNAATRHWVKLRVKYIFRYFIDE